MLFRMKGAEVYYEIVGEGKPVIIIHGCAPDHRLMQRCMESVFAKYKGYQRIYIDLPGMGKSNAPDWINSSDHMLELLIGCIEKIIPSKSFLLVGESYGGYLARGILTKLFERANGLLLVCPVVVAEQEKRTRPNKQVIVEDKEFLNTLTSTDREEFCKLAVVANEYTYKRFKEEIKPGLTIANYEFIDRLQKNYSLTMNFHHKTYEKPVLLLVGRQDISVGYKDIIGIIDDYPRATLAVLDMAGHNLQIEQPELFESLVGEWIRRTDQQSL